MVAGLWTGVAAQSPAGPTMEETRAWLESDGRDLMRVSRLQTDPIRLILSTSEERVDTMTLNACTLSWRLVRMASSSGRGRVTPTTTITTDVILMLQDVGGVTVEPDTFQTDTPVAKIRFAIRQPTLSTQSINNDNPAVIKAASLPAQTTDDGQRIANAVKRAMVLCVGAPATGVF